MLLQASRARVFLRLCIRHVRWLLLARSTRSNKTCLRAPPRPPPPCNHSHSVPPRLAPSSVCSYLQGQLSEAEGSLDGCSKTCSRQAEYVSKLTFEIEETDKKLVLEAERMDRQERRACFYCSLFISHSLRQAERRIRAAQWQHQSQQAGTQVDARRNSATSNCNASSATIKRA